MKSAVTVSLVPAARGGPFVYWDDLPAACRRAVELGFDAVEVFAPGPEVLRQPELVALAAGDDTLRVAAVGTGAGWLQHQWTLTSPDEQVREQGVKFIESMIEAAGPLQAPVIIGSMQGRWGASVSREQALSWLRTALDRLGRAASRFQLPVIYEPLNRYETNLCNTVAAGVELVESLSVGNVVLLADLFHMNIEEENLAQAVRSGSRHIGHVHFVDSNRRPAGCGHLEYRPVIAALHEIGYQGYLSAECFPWPDSETAARQTIKMFDTLTA